MHAGVSFGDCPIRQFGIPVFTPVVSAWQLLTSVGWRLLQLLSIVPVEDQLFLRHETCRTVTEQLVYGRSGPRVILGDFACPAGSLVAMKHWISQGWVDLQSFLHHSFGVEPQTTCKASTSPDHMCSRLKCSHLL